MLKESEWNTINTILLELYTLSDVEPLARKALSQLRLLVPFSKGYFIRLDESHSISVNDSVFIGFEDGAISKYLNTYYEKDYLQYLFSLNHETTVYQDSLIMDDSVRENTEFFQRFLKPADIPFGAGILVIKDGRVLGIFNLFRDSNFGDFSEKDMYILSILKKHLENMLVNALRLQKTEEAGDLHFSKAVSNFSLSDREADVLRLIADGKSNGDISEQIHVSVSTVKKHVYNIFNKAGVNSRTQLLNMVYSIH